MEKTITEAKKAKGQLKKNILQLIHEFQKESGVKVTELSIITKYMNDGGDEKLWDVQIKVEI